MKNLFIAKPNLKKGLKIVKLILEDNKGNQYDTEYSNVSDVKDLNKRTKDLERISKELDEKLKKL